MSDEIGGEGGSEGEKGARNDKNSKIEYHVLLNSSDYVYQIYY